MKTFFLILLIVFFSCCAVKSPKYNNDILGTWVAYSMQDVKTKDSWSNNTYMLKISKDSLAIGSTICKEESTFSYLQTNSSIHVNDSINFDIINISPDSITVRYNKSKNISLIRLPFKIKNKCTISEVDLLNGSWYYSFNNFKQRIEFSENKWKYNNEDTKICYTHPVEDNLYKSSQCNKWRLFEYNGNSYFSRSFNQFYNLLHQIIDVSEDTIYTKAFNNGIFVYPILTKIQKISESKRIDINKKS